MSDIKNLLEKMDAMSAAERKPTGPEWPGYLKGTDSAKKSRSRMVGDGGAAESVEESENFLKELNTVINSNPVKRDLFQEWQEYKSISEADKTVSPDQRAQIRKDVKAVDYGKEPQPTTPPSPQQKAGIKQAVSDYNKEKEPKKQTVDEETAWEHEPTTVDVEMQRPTNVSKSKLDYNDPDVKFFHVHKDGRKEEVPKGSPNYNEYWRDVTGREDPMTQELVRGIENPRQPGPEYKVPEPNNMQDLKIPGQDKGRYRAPLPNWKETEPIISEYGAPGSAIGNDTARNPAEEFAKGQERKASKEQTQGQIQGLVAQITGLRRQLADLNKQFPQGANPVEKTMSLQQMTAQRNAIKSQIVDLAKQIAQLRQQAI
jgi:hypothetical protein